jgi:hypothetical protein
LTDGNPFRDGDYWPQHGSEAIRNDSRQCDEFDRALDAESWDEVLLSVRVLIDFLHISRMPASSDLCAERDTCTIARPFPPVDVITGPFRPSLRPIRHRAVTESLQCPANFELLSHKLSHRTLYCLSGVPGNLRPWIDHDICLNSSRCEAFSVRNEEFLTRHTSLECTCLHVELSAKSMYRILANGGFPVLKCERTETGIISLKYERALPDTDYVAISHVWSDGLGNPHGNSVPYCQMDRILDILDEANSCADTTTPRRPGTVQSGQRSITFRIWFDVYCVPIVPPAPAVKPLLPLMESHGDEYLDYLDLEARLIPTSPTGSDRDKKLKALAHTRMAATYSWAKYILDLNEGLLRYTPTEGPIRSPEFHAQLALSAWNSRSWTYHELYLAKRYIVATKSGPVLEHGTSATILWPLG